MADKKIVDKVMDWINKPVTVESTIQGGRVHIRLMSNNTFLFGLDNIDLSWCYSKVLLKDGTEINTKDCKRTSYTISATDTGYLAKVFYKKDDYQLTQHFIMEDSISYFKMFITLTKNDQIISSNRITPMQIAYPGAYSHPMFTNVEEKMLMVPYDNDMWVHYQSAYPTPAATSYDVTVLYDEETLNGIVIGALDFNFWKNGIICSSYDARVFDVVSGIADGGTHDCVSHGYLTSKELKSSTFVVGYYDDIRLGLEQYSLLAKNPDALHSNTGVIFGWNSYSALGHKMDLEHYSYTSQFIKDNLPEFKGNDGVTYINLDSTFGLDKGKLKKIVKEIHKNGQKAGTYLAPLCHLDVMNLIPLKGSLLKFRKDIVLKKADGSNYEPIDSKYPIDITIPEAEKDLRLQIRDIIDMGFDYLKIDFLSHGAVEGQRYDRKIKTGRQALNYFYSILKDEIKDSNLFISLSIAPLFPCGNGMARRVCCDSFGHGQDVKYVLNALTYSWWTNNTLYDYNDPDHTVLYNSFIDGKGNTTLNEARSRYNASVISGSLMLLSDDYGTKDAENKEIQQRTIQLANNSDLNQLALKHLAFKPVTLNTTSNYYYLNDGEETYLAVFNFENKINTFSILPELFNGPKEGKAYNLNTHRTYNYSNKITIQLDCYDSVILKLNNK